MFLFTPNVFKEVEGRGKNNRRASFPKIEPEDKELIMVKVRNCTKYSHWLPDELLEELRETSKIIGIPMSVICKRAIIRELVAMEPIIKAAKDLDDGLEG